MASEGRLGPFAGARAEKKSREKRKAVRAGTARERAAFALVRNRLTVRRPLRRLRNLALRGGGFKPDRCAARQRLLRTIGILGSSCAEVRFVGCTGGPLNKRRPPTSRGTPAGSTTKIGSYWRIAACRAVSASGRSNDKACRYYGPEIPVASGARCPIAMSLS